jgi:hypothetical protein
LISCIAGLDNSGDVRYGLLLAHGSLYALWPV